VRKYGVRLTRFLDYEHVIHSSTVDNTLRLLNITGDGYLRYFPGHADEVTSIAVSKSLTFASAAKDSSVRLWDPRTQTRIKMMNFPSLPLVAFHPTGDVIAVAYKSSIVELFAKNNFDESSNKFEFEKIDGVEWTGIKFSDNGKNLLVTTNSSSILVFDAVLGKEKHNFRDFSNIHNEFIDACFTPVTSDFVFGGSADGKIHIWDMETSLKRLNLPSGYSGAAHHVAFNPKFMNLATTSDGKNLLLWIEKD
jgi:COMPASS component SWD2